MTILVTGARRTVVAMTDAARSDRGRHVLQREGHPAGLRRWRMSDAEWHEFNTHPITRDMAAIAAVMEEARHDRTTLGREHWPHLDAIVLAIAWAVDGEGSAPLTGQGIVGARPTWVEIAEEIDAAEDVLYGKREDRRGQGYAVGVEHALMWLIDDTDETPV